MAAEARMMARRQALPAGLEIFDLTGRVALVTGASRGLGRALALALGSAGAHVVLAARSQLDLYKVADQIEAGGSWALPVQTDMTNPDDVDRVVNAAISHFGKIDILVNNVGGARSKLALDLPLHEFDEVINLNLRSTFVASRAVAPHMIANGYGRIINITSILSSIAYQNQAACAAAKGAIAQLTKVLAIEWANKGITVNCIGPTFFETDYNRERLQEPGRKEFVINRTPMGRWGQPHELAGTAIFLASESSGFITGQTIFVDGGWLAW